MIERSEALILLADTIDEVFNSFYKIDFNKSLKYLGWNL